MRDQLRTFWTASLGAILAILMFGLNVSHAMDPHFEVENHKSHCDAFVGSEPQANSSQGDDHTSGQHTHTALHHCHGASCYFLPNVTSPDVAAPAVSDNVLGSPALLRLSFGIDGEEIDPPRVG